MDTVVIGRDAQGRSVRVVPRRTCDDLVAPPAHWLRFPRHWAATPVRNRFATLWGGKTLEWLRQFGMGQTRDEAARLDKFVCADYGGYALPLANYATGLLVTQYISLWLFWDDMQLETETEWDVDAVIHALGCCCTAKSSSRYLRAWSDLGERLRRTQSEFWVQALCTSMRRWLDNSKVEAVMARAYAERRRCPSWEETLACRTVSIGMYPTFLLDEFGGGFELDPLVRCHPSIRRLQELAARLVGFGNDLGSVAKDLRARWLNLVPVLSESQGLPLDEAFRHIVAVHNREVLEFDRIAVALPSFGLEQDVLLSAWVESVRYNVYGFTLWESTAERYQESVALLGDAALIAPVMTFDDPAA